MKRTILSMMVLLAAGAASAQSEGWSRWSVTPKVGMNISTMTGKPFPVYFNTHSVSEVGDVDTRVGLHAGVEAEWRMNKWIGLSVGAGYSQLGYSTDVTMTESSAIYGGLRKGEGGVRLHAGDEVWRTLEHTKRLSLHYLTVPVKVNVHLWRGLTVSAGLQYGRLLSARQVGDSQMLHGTVLADDFLLDGATTAYEGVAAPPLSADGLQNVEHSSGSFSHSHRSSCHRNEASVPIGVSYEWQHVVLAADYHIGLTKLEDDQHNRSLSITLGYRFGL